MTVDLWCYGCDTTLPAEKFSMDRRRKRGRQSRCKDCNRAYAAANRARKAEYDRNRYAENRQQIRAQHQAYAEANRDTITEKKRAYYRENRDAFRDYRLRNSERRAAQRREWAERNPEYATQYRAEHRDRHREREASRRAAKRGTQVADVTEPLLVQRVAYYGDKCWICREAPYEHLDHVKPLSKGGPHILSNLRPACAPCNIRKSDTWPLETGK